MLEGPDFLFGTRNPKERTLTLTVGITRFVCQESIMNNIIWLIGAIVVVLAILSFLGLR